MLYSMLAFAPCLPGSEPKAGKAGIKLRSSPRRTRRRRGVPIAAQLEPFPAGHRRPHYGFRVASPMPAATTSEMPGKDALVLREGPCNWYQYQLKTVRFV